MKVWELRNAFVKLDTLSEEMLNKELEGVDVSFFQQRIAEEWAKGEEALADKLEGIARMIKNYQHLADAYEKEEREFARRKNTMRNQITFMKNSMIKGAMEAAKLEKIECGVFKFSLRKSKAVEIRDEKSLPAEYIKIKETRTIDKKQISADLKEGKEVPGAYLKENKSVQVR